ncbi:MAG: acyl-CoA dehydrogenase family protein [Bacillota bacterium]|jgi:alkylation response protein AidB-like acyl-CoA dehydrogenase
MFNESHELIRKLTRDFTQKEIKPVAAEIDKTGVFPRELLDKMAQLGFFGIKMPKEFGGAGADIRSYAIVMEEIARVSGVASIYISAANSLAGAPFLTVGTKYQQEKYLRPMIGGTKIIAFALTEPDAGSDVGAIACSAVKEGDYYVLNGRKCFITAAPLSDYILTFAKTDPSKGIRGITTFIVDSKQEGVSFGKPEDKMGMIGCATSDVILENVLVHQCDVLGEINKGFTTAMQTLDLGRVGVASQAIGIAQGAIDEAVKYAKERKQFGKPLAKFQAIQFMLAEMETKLNAAKLLVYHAAKMLDQGKHCTKEAAMAKYFASESAIDIVSKALQIHGGYGYIKDYPIERMYRDVRVLSIYEGTTQVQQMVISGILLK